MKRKNENDFINTKKKAKHLTERQTEIAHFINEKLEEEETEWATSLLKNIFFEDKKIEALLTCTNYKPFIWAIEHQNLKLIKYFIEHNTPRGSFLMLCQNNYENIYKFINIFIKNNKENTKQEKDSFIDIMKLFINVKPAQIIPLFQKIINEKSEIQVILNLIIQESYEEEHTEDNLKTLRTDENIESSLTDPYEMKNLGEDIKLDNI